MVNANQIMTWDGGTIKSLGNNRIAGYLVLFSDVENVDLVGDYFDAKTDFYGLEDGDKAIALWHHGLDPSVSGPIGKGTLKYDDNGIWYEAQLSARKEYEDRLADIIRLIEDDKVGFSSGSPGHLVKRSKKSESAHHIDAWQIAEASLTCTPCEPRAMVSLKSLVEYQQEGKTLQEETDDLIKVAASYTDRIKNYCEMKRHEDRKVSPEKRDQIKTIRDQLTGILADLDAPDQLQAMRLRILRQKFTANA